MKMLGAKTFWVVFRIFFFFLEEFLKKNQMKGWSSEGQSWKIWSQERKNKEAVSRGQIEKTFRPGASSVVERTWSPWAKRLFYLSSALLPCLIFTILSIFLSLKKIFSPITTWSNEQKCRSCRDLSTLPLRPSENKFKKECSEWENFEQFMDKQQ